eukprot:TRINITY_DN411_c1_g2_i1.p1 TRINITY_DN411_c1_g2~~TRINITY_DN411_c1_g2_i1.p1  ORF type:complete len:350 (+),score=72.63 TRINITY_DN411_c1_g2_i1:57-1052(+)
MLMRTSALMATVAAAAAADSMSFLAIGDWGGTSDTDPTAPGEVDNNKGMGAVASQHGDTQFVLALGDNFYSAGISGDDHCTRFETTFEDVFTHPSLQVPWYVVAGNHDHLGNVTAQIAYSQLSKRWTFPSLYYTFTESFVTSSGKNVTTQIIYIDTVVLSGMSYHDEEKDIFVKPTGPAPEHVELAATQLQWLEQELSNSKADYLWVAGHYPVYSQCSHGPTQQLITDVLPMLTKYKANGFLAGHDHCLGHFEQDGLAFVLSGAGKECCYAPKHASDVPAGITKFHMDSSNTYGTDGGFTSFVVTETSTTIHYHASNGTTIFIADPVSPRS